MNNIGVIILGVNHATGLGVLRSLGEKGIYILAVDKKQSAYGFYSKYVKEKMLLPLEKEKHLDQLLKLGHKKQGWMLIPTSDYFVSLVSKNWERLHKFFILTTPPWNIIEVCLDKGLTYKIATELGINIPQTYWAKNEEEFKEIANKIDFKTKEWILKTRSRSLFHIGQEELFFNKKAIKIKSKNDLIQNYLKHFKETEASFLIQEIIPGMPHRNIILRTVINRELKPLVVISDKKIRQIPLFFGVGSYRESSYEPEAIRIGLNLLKKIGYYGMAYVEFKRDPRDEKLKLIEINPRFTTGVSLAKACGIDLAYVLYNSFCDVEEETRNVFTIGIRWSNILFDISTILNHRTFLPWRKTFFDIISNLHRTKAFANLSLKDPAPFLHILVKRYK